ncbi:MAG: hypothetical protein A2902_03500 [Elusimicrobia bacterium RIFCSPLOWO2_01_FULL_64_13]|nr:MAG: hypothetical protein A2636_05570 [Elusimicrobia bacterium RIFCSPHIGHO2_01_FULL_64_10]OGR97196.1 MAG: hypothetical protein A2902_03500 [Elusimicrobia bacterium RIFCSPLOWO2_01_FULL_64_13]
MPPLTTYEISRYLHVDLTTVISWCELGKMRAYKTPGGHRRVQPGDFLDFLKQFGMPVPRDFNSKMNGALKALIVDDEDNIRRVIRRALTKNVPKVEVFEARDGFEAGKMLLDAHPHLVVLDLMLPGINGFRVCSNIRKDPRFMKTKILAITGRDTDENREKILKEGADAYLAKPFDVDGFMEQVRRLVKIDEEQEKWTLAAR